MSDSNTVMPFGKHKGKTIEDLPSSYLHWLAENCEDDALTNAIHTWPDDTDSIRIRKKDAGRLLDDREWNEYPETHNALLNG
ncbi:MAG: putative quorum-sensing-regulated virulence factor [Gammaproteobacteria bacterium]